MSFLKRLQFLWVLLVAGSILVAAHVAIRQFAEPGDRVYEFIYQRGPVQHVILVVAGLVVGLLLDRFSRSRWRSATARMLQTHREPPRALAEDLGAMSRTLNDHGPAAAMTHIKRWEDHQHEQIRKTYESINGLAGALPALGLIGTMLGLSGGLYAAFHGGGLSDKAVQTFVSSLATAMDTTVLAMLCAIPCFTASWILSRGETDVAEQLAGFIRQRLGLDDVIAGDHDGQVMQAELRRMTRRLAKEAEVAFGQLVENAVVGFHERLEQAVVEVLTAQREHNEQLLAGLAEGVADRLGRSLDEMGSLIERHNGRLAEGMIEQFGNLERALRNRTPEELVIRYQHNGRVNGSAVRSRIGK